MVISKLNIFPRVRQTQANTEIALKSFVDFYFDTVGWYAMGHHDPEEFLRAVVKREPNTPFSLAQVQLTWAKFEGNDFEITDVPMSGTQAITLIENWGEYC
ncbi:MAG: hypothetical protein ACRDEA_11540 [Microcystaceae cyanobacterium]